MAARFVAKFNQSLRFYMTDLNQTLTSSQNNTPVKIIGVAIFLILIWGSAFTLIDIAVLTLSPAWIVAYRMVIGASSVSYTHLTLPTILLV